MTPTIYIPCDSGALALGADKVAAAIEKELAARGAKARIVRTGSRGRCGPTRAASPTGR